MLQRTLFELVGGQRKLDAMLDEFIRRVKADPDLGPLYPDDMSNLKSYYRDFAMEMLDGPKKWTEGGDASRLRQVHRDIPITKRRADAMVNCAMDTLEHFGVPKFVQEAAQQRLESAVYDMVNTDDLPFPEPPAEAGDRPQPWS
ncbi:hypothetical protein [Alicyclobacillus sp.]|uniref:truncated hemoglobin n=1 Tax=Alicyclobacillus sp. TaxID=61169 RepID=UPI0025BCF538|nr:hypothetical protein [Alicyclobacillus sp.]MCL6517479.1 hypothetical protein [Alicyclobacillus sp.]